MTYPLISDPLFKRVWPLIEPLSKTRHLSIQGFRLSDVAGKTPPASDHSMMNGAYTDDTSSERLVINIQDELFQCKSSKDLGHNSLRVKRDFHTL